MERVAVIESIVQLVAQNDREVLERVLTDTLCEILAGASALLVRIEAAGEDMVAVELARTGGDCCSSLSPVQCRALAEAAAAAADAAQSCVRLPCIEIKGAAFSVPLVNDSGRTVLVVCGRRMSKSDCQVALGLATIFKNYLNLLGASQTDGLTRLLNRKTFDEKLDAVIRDVTAHHASHPDDRRIGHGEGTWLAVADIDHFKRINDTYGHVFGDEVLLIFSQIMRQTFRREDLLFRYGGEEFAVVLTQADHDGALAVLDRFRAAVAARTFPQVGQVTCSIGVTRVGSNEVPTALFGRADQALYFAKQNGRDQVRCHDDLLAEGLLKPVTASADAELF